jgi:uncharacterized protein YndB with AHSA1/START domain
MSRSHETIIDIKTTPEELFRALTDPTQIVKWFAPEARVDPQVGGEYFFSWGPGMEGRTIISAWEPNTHFGTGKERSVTYGSKGTPVDTGVMRRIAVDYYIESIGDGVTRLRLVQSGFGPEAAWDDEVESIKTGWNDFLKKLKEVLEG